MMTQARPVLALPVFGLFSLALSPACAAPGESAGTAEAMAVEPEAPVARSTEPLVEARGWLSWRGPQQNGTSRETGLPETVTPGAGAGWVFRLAGRGTPVIANGRVYAMGYEGEGHDLQEVLVCLDAVTGERIWEQRFTEFLSDAIYYRFAIGSPTVDPETGNVLCLTTAGLFSCFSPDGELLWQHCMMSEYGRLTFPNGRTGSPLVDGELAIVHVISSSWGPQGPARDRFYAFDKRTGESVWSSTPGGPPTDSSFSMPVVATEGGKRVLYAGLGGGNLVCVNVLTGDPIWRFQMATGGVNSSPVLYRDRVIQIHGKENIDTSAIGRMVAIRRGAEPGPGEEPLVLGAESELWRADLVAFTSSPVLVGNRVFQTVATGELACVDADTGRVLWQEKLAPDQIHASPAWGDGKLYVPMNNGSFHVVRPSDEGAEILQTVQLEGNCLGAPAIAAGRIYVHTTAGLYCFAGGQGELPPPVMEPGPLPVGAPVRLQVIPADFLAVQGDRVSLRVRSLDANGRAVSESLSGIAWSGLGAGVTIDERGVMTIAADARPAAFVARAAADGLTGSARVRVVPGLPTSDDFDDTALQPHPDEEGVQYAPARPYWIGAMRKWEIRELEGEQVLAKTLDNPLFQRAMSSIGHPDMTGYTMQVDIMSDGNRRSMSSAGLVTQRYLIQLKGNHQELEVSSNVELLKESVPFRWRPGTWYTLKTRVDLEDDGSGWVRAKAWQRDEAEPDAWTIEVRHPNAHTKGAPGFFGFSPQSRFRVYIDNLSVIPNE